MKSSLRYLTFAAFFALACGGAWLVARPTLTAWNRGGPGDGSIAPAKVDHLQSVLAHNIHIDDSGDRQLLLAISNLETHSSVTARIRQQAAIGDYPHNASGTYKQLGTGTRRNVRWLLNSQRNGVPCTVLQISDGRFLWTVRNLASGQYIDNVDLWQLRRKSSTLAQQVAVPAAGEASSSPISIHAAANFGGLPMLLESLRENFEFTAPRKFRMPDGSEVIGLVGRWQPEALAATLLPRPRKQEEETETTEEVRITAAGLRESLDHFLQHHSLPERVPHHILLLLGREDLFPRVIEYRNQRDPLADPGLAESELFQFSARPLAKLEFYDIAFDAQVDSRDFLYTPPPTPQWRDKTSNYQQRMERSQQLRTALEEERRMANTPNEPHR